MRAVLQRVRRGRVTIDGAEVGAIGKGLVILLGIGKDDDQETAVWVADKCAALRIFEDLDGKMNLSLAEVGGEVMVISQFTLYADTHKGRRPSFIEAASPDLAEPLVAAFAKRLRQQNLSVAEGVFGAQMLVEIENDGPVTVLLER